ncbi:hypothetical protein JKG68_29385 [Microvirga aerilata]|uniref:DUF6894 domain-containing protein n=1 Tax=Microvirga aerilata TaxID=670292 RepID=A0A937D4X4_9HYPH|nr:hypothetical protein [Microvirga aerilata]MBL0408015.1 hypothetical protein [Microvirga aerilata]
MQRYFFDTYDGDKLLPDEIGVELADLDEAERELARSLPAMAQETFPKSDHREFAVRVRDDEGKTVLKAALTLVMERTA